MPKTLQHRRGTTSELSSVTGAAGEIFYDTTKDTLVVMDGSTAGGYPLEKEGAGTGATGPQGAAGATGSQGPQGASGVSGGGGGGTGDYTFSANTITLPSNTDAIINTSSIVNTSVTYTDPDPGFNPIYFSWQGGEDPQLPNYLNVREIATEATAALLNTSIGDTISVTKPNGSQFTLTTTSAPGSASDAGGNYVRVEVDSFPAEYSVNLASITFPSTSTVNNQFVLQDDGTLVSDSAIIGETFIANDIITPLALDSYGLVDSTATGTLTVNGNLDVLGGVYVDGSKTFLSDTKYQQREALFGDAGVYYDNIGIGRDALKNAVTPATGNYSAVSYLNTAIGVEALESLTTGHDNVAIGQIALKAITAGSDNVAVGNGSSRYMTEAYYNVGVGINTFSSCTTGNNNVAVGKNALYYMVTNELNTAIGGDAGADFGRQSTAGEGNTFVGALSGRNKKGGSNNTYIGRNARAGDDSNSQSTTGNNNTVIGYSAVQSSITVSNEITLGNSSIDTLRCQVTSITSLSDARDKKDIETLGAGLDFVSKLKPVSFNWNMRDGAKVDVADTGFIAQDLKQVQEETGITIPGLVYESNPDKLEAAYGKLIPVLVKAIQDLQAEVEALKSK